MTEAKETFNLNKQCCSLIKFTQKRKLKHNVKTCLMKVADRFAAILLVSTTLAASAAAAEIKVCVEARQAGIDTDLSGAIVKCYDEDFDADDFMGQGTTGSNGCVTVNYSKRSPKWYSPCNGWDCAGTGHDNPDIYCEVTKSGYYPVSLE